MSIEAVKGFYEKIASDEELVKQLDEIQNKTTEGLEPPLAPDKKEELVKDVIIPFAKEQGFDFSIEDIKEYEQSIVEQLDDEQLESIAAGSVRAGGGIGIGMCRIVGYGVGFTITPGGVVVCALVGFGKGNGGCLALGAGDDDVS